MAEVREGGCGCGAVRYRISVDPIFVNCCHCTDCQRETGSAFAINAMVEAAEVEVIKGEPKPVTIPSASGKGQRVWRCPECGVALWSNYSGAGPGVNFMRVATLDEPAGCPPDAHIYVRSKLPWVTLPEGVPAFEGFYDPKAQWPAEGLARVRAAKPDRS